MQITKSIQRFQLADVVVDQCVTSRQYIIWLYAIQIIAISTSGLSIQCQLYMHRHFPLLLTYIELRQ